MGTTKRLCGLRRNLASLCGSTTAAQNCCSCWVHAAGKTWTSTHRSNGSSTPSVLCGIDPLGFGFMNDRVLKPSVCLQLLSVSSIVRYLQSDCGMLKLRPTSNAYAAAGMPQSPSCIFSPGDTPAQTAQTRCSRRPVPAQVHCGGDVMAAPGWRRGGAWERTRMLVLSGCDHSCRRRAP